MAAANPGMRWSWGMLAHTPPSVDISPPAVQGITWRRCRASRRDSTRPPLGIYFDHGSSGSTQRGWADGRRHDDCNRQRQVFGNSRADYVAYMLAWESADTFDSKEDHMKHEPGSAMVALVRDALVLEDF